MKLLDLLRRTTGGAKPAGPHMTWASSRVGRSVSRTGVFLRQQLWIWPIIAIVILSTLGFVVRRSIETTMRESVQAELQVLVDIKAEMVENWFRVQRSNAEAMANDVEVREIAYKILDAQAALEPLDEKSAAELHIQLDKALAPAMSAHDYTGFIAADKSQRIVSSTRRELIGREQIPEYESFLRPALSGRSDVSTPFASIIAIPDEHGKLQVGVPTMFVSAPLRDASFQVVGALALRIRPDEEFTRIMQLGRFGETGETYAIDRNGLFLSNSRFDEQLICLRLLPDRDDSHSIVQMVARDPGGDMTEGFLPETRPRDQPLTRMAAALTKGQDGADVDGYRDFRGVPVVGAWKWLPDAELGVTCEVDYAEAFRPLTILRRVFWGLFALLVISALAIFVFTLMVHRLRKQAQKAAIDAQQLGQYTLEQKLGAGGMGVVYKGRHAMLRRPTAIKMLDVDKVNEGSIERFEREVQITSQLNHPNTVAIYDYGRTPEGVFYYAMEYLDGIDLENLVQRYGPQPASRVIHILSQVCGSLYEAHTLGMVHRDIKPSNIMLNRRGQEPDVVKVLDFGLVKALDEQKRSGLTQQGSMTGTPLYMSPEAIQLPGSVDARSDIYAVGAVGYFLLTGEPVFMADNVLELCQQHMTSTPMAPSARIGESVPAALEEAILACLEKSRTKRPQTARDLAQMLEKCVEARTWSIDEADAWWGRHERGIDLTTGPKSRSSNSSGYEATIDQSTSHTK